MNIDWKYFFGGSSNNGKSFQRYYKSEINGLRVERCCSHKGTKYCIGNMDEAKVKHNSEEELLSEVAIITNKAKTEEPDANNALSETKNS